MTNLSLDTFADADSEDCEDPADENTDAEAPSRLETAVLVVDAARADPKATARLVASETEARLRDRLAEAEDWLSERYADATERRTRFYQAVVALGLFAAWLSGQSGNARAFWIPASVAAVGPFLWYAEESELWNRFFETSALLAGSLLAGVLGKATVAPYRPVDEFVTETPVGRLTAVVFDTSLTAVVMVGSVAVTWWFLKAYRYRRTSPEDRVLTDGGDGE